MKAVLHPCYILHQRRYRETSLLLEIFSRDYGRLTLVARGARRGKSGIGNIMQINQKLNIAWTSRGEMGTLTAIETSGTNYNLDGSRLIASFYMNELLMRLLHKYEPHPELFDYYDISLIKLQRRDSEESVLRIFEIHLLESLGYGLVLDHDVKTGAPINIEDEYYYLPDAGPAAAASDGHGHVKLSGATLKALAHGDITESGHLREAKALTRIILNRHLGDRPLASRKLFGDYVRNRKG